MNDPVADKAMAIVIALVIVAFVIALFPGITQVFAVLGVAALLYAWGFVQGEP